MVRDDVSLQHQLLEFLLRGSSTNADYDPDEAVYWVKQCQVNCEELKPWVHSKLDNAIADGRGSDCYSTPFQTDVEENYHQIPLKAEQIVDVDTIEAFEAMCEALRPHYILAMDCEFYTVGSNAMVALMQIACPDKVYLVDLYTIYHTSDNIYCSFRNNR